MIICGCNAYCKFCSEICTLSPMTVLLMLPNYPKISLYSILQLLTVQMQSALAVAVDDLSLIKSNVH